MRTPARLVALSLLSLVVACTPAARTGTSAAAPAGDPHARIARLIGALAHDSMEGRATGTVGGARAARLIAEEMRRIGLEPAGDDDHRQRIPIVLTRVLRRGATDSSWIPRAAASFAALDTVPAARRGEEANVVGILRGVDPVLRDSAIVVAAHHDHVGIGRPVEGDSIYNGADDDASGVVAVLEIARALRAGPAPKRTIVFATFTGEEMGGVGSRWYLAHPVVPLARTVAQLQVEMIGRPDSLVGGAGRAWLTGYERSTLGETLAARGIPLVADPRPQQNFFRRSDNYAFARAGIPAHTLSSFDLHPDYHRPSDEAARIDVAHMVRVIDAATRAVRLMADGDAPQWKPGGRP
ncbi:MAG TPA: M20/M25/M40 family metallo-hydrolase [Gemmatimonadaceae bacterium]|nr:M20/M25/M40 family metallo-hydrolase [Gemmatimonadaceae bacterium]